jgi:hypothetical protein
MSRGTYFLCFVCLGGVTFFVLHLIRDRLRKCYPSLYLKLGSPAFQDSNLGKTYWNFQRFVWWGYRSEVPDALLRGLCILACACQLGVLVLFFLSM